MGPAREPPDYHELGERVDEFLEAQSTVDVSTHLLGPAELRVKHSSTRCIRTGWRKLGESYSRSLSLNPAPKPDLEGPAFRSRVDPLGKAMLPGRARRSCLL
eukprot:8151875-Pyramimonas_sp.AAC.1